MFLLRLAFILPALADFLLAVLALSGTSGIADPSILPRVQFAGVAFAWGCLLLVGLIRPIERAWILLPTMIAIAGVLMGFVVGYVAGDVRFERVTLNVVLGGIMIVLGWWGVRFAATAASRAD